ncbi:MAG TPA: arginine--tRNA ligase, partial [Candidatus Dormibacteraeota bacterium]|nr:arginine--tRNA ligase [Candidatus Dormibacteraeota bacterium]
MTDAATPTSDQPAARVPGGPTGARGPAVSPPPSPRQAAAAYLQPHVTAFLDAQGVIDHPALVLERPARPEHGDLALNLALRLAKPLGRRPLDIANDLAAAIPAGGPIAAVAVAPPGFLNLRLDLAWLFGTMREVVAAGPHWGRLDFGAGQRVQVEFVSANPTGPLLFSHGRGAVVGDTVARLLDFTGHAVEREFYVNDAGRQVRVFGMSLVAARLGRPAPDDGYSGEYIQELAAAIPDEVWGGEPERLTRVTDWGIQHYLAEYRQHLGDIGIGFDHWFSERDLYGEWSEATRAVLAAQGAIAEHDGATWITLPDGQEEVLVKSTGDGTYFWGDILYHRDKLVRRGFARAIDVWGADHQNQVRRVKDVLSLFGV